MSLRVFHLRNTPPRQQATAKQYRYLTGIGGVVEVPEVTFLRLCDRRTASRAIDVCKQGHEVAVRHAEPMVQCVTEVSRETWEEWKARATKAKAEVAKAARAAKVETAQVETAKAQPRDLNQAGVFLVRCGEHLKIGHADWGKDSTVSGRLARLRVPAGVAGDPPRDAMLVAAVLTSDRAPRALIGLVREATGRRAVYGDWYRMTDAEVERLIDGLQLVERFDRPVEYEVVEVSADDEETSKRGAEEARRAARLSPTEIEAPSSELTPAAWIRPQTKTPAELAREERERRRTARASEARWKEAKREKRGRKKGRKVAAPSSGTPLKKAERPTKQYTGARKKGKKPAYGSTEWTREQRERIESNKQKARERAECSMAD